jgi:diguanylate cyclase (GGDEF)-like protein
MKVEFSKVHRRLGPVLFFPLLATALTGVAYHLGEIWLETPSWVGDILIKIHQGEFLGEKLVPIYILLIGIGILAMSLTGLNLLDRPRSDINPKQTQLNSRSIHRLLALILLFPLTVSAEAGVAYRLGKDWFGMSSEQAEIFLKIHQGSYLGKTFNSFYVILLGLGLVGLLVAGIKMTPLGRSKIPRWRLSQSPTPTLSKSALSDTVISLRRKVWLGIAICSVLLIAIIYSVTATILSQKYDALTTDVKTQPTIYFPDLLIPIGIVGLIFGLLASFLAEKLIQNWQRQKEIQATLYETEAKSHTILKAVPDSMLHMRQDGTCLSYIPAKGAKSFILNGDIVGKPVSDLLPLEIAQHLVKQGNLALKSGSTRIYQFAITLNGEKQYQEARISAIGETEILVMIREIPDPEQAKIEAEKLSETNGDISVSLLNQQELIQLLELTLEDTKKHDRHHLLCYVAVDQLETIYDNHGFSAGDRLLDRVAARLGFHLPSTDLIARLDNNDLALLLRDYSLEEGSMLADQLRQSLNDFSFLWENDEYAITVSIGLVEIDAKSTDVISIMSAADAACNIAKWKITSKAFW